ncbi:HtaA domain-containing protein [Streptomyces sp. CA-181903]|uniref:HtaA domain-containing protein n=1 Tax=Streptomyces sp. CA-181903 TaxID=3240055 RepID=UPI003D8BFCD0
MAVTQRRTAFTAAVATAIALGATVLTLPARAAGEEPDAAAKQPTGFQLKDATLTWGIKESFRQYVTGKEADGTIRVADGAEQADGNGAFTFSGGKGTYDREKHSFTTAFKGSVRFLGHAKGEGKKKHWDLDVKFSDLKVIGEGGKGRVTADVTTSGKTRDDVTLATLDLAKGESAGKNEKDEKDGKGDKAEKDEKKTEKKADKSDNGNKGDKGDKGGKDHAKDDSKSDAKDAKKDAKSDDKADGKNDVPALAKVPASLTADGAKALTYKKHSVYKTGASLDNLSLSVKQSAPLPLPDDHEPAPIPSKKPAPDSDKVPAPKPKEPSEPKKTPESKETPSSESKPEGVDEGKVWGPEEESLVPRTGDPKGGTEGTGGSSASPGTTGSTGSSETPGTTGSTGSSTEQSNQLAADSTVYDGRLDWGVSQAFRTAITGSPANGKIEVSGGAEQRDTGFRFTKAKGKYDTAKSQLVTAEFEGSVRFLAYQTEKGAEVEVTVSKLKIDGAKKQLWGHVSNKVGGKPAFEGDVALADLLYTDSLTAANGVVTLNTVQATLTEDGKKALTIRGFKPNKSDGLDPVTAKIAVNKDAKLDDDSTGTNTDGTSPSGTGTGTSGTGSSSGTGTGTGTDDSLAHTGNDTPTGPLVGSAAALVLAGGTAVWTARRKSAKLTG